jgi:anaerobic selenocysteine-containing dehydrogenase
MNPRDARHLGLKAQDHVDVVSQRGRVRDVELRITETIAPGQVFVPFHYAEANANQVTQSAFDPISREPNYKQSAVRVEKTGIGDQGSGIKSWRRSSRSPVPDPRSPHGGRR